MSFNIEPYFKFMKSINKERIEIIYDTVKKHLSLGKENNMSFEHLVEAIDRISDDFLEASDLFLIAENEYERFKLYMKEEMSRLNGEAQTELEKKKKDKKITSQITKELKEDWIIENKKEEYGELMRTQRQLSLIRDRMENLKEATRQRMSSLQSQARVAETRRQVKLGRAKEN